SRHLRWCASALDGAAGRAGGLDGVAMEVRAAIGGEWGSRADREAASDLARRFAELAFEAGEARAAQLAFERAAALTDSDTLAAELLVRAAGAAESRHFGGDALAL